MGIIKRYAALDQDGNVIAFGLGARFRKDNFSFNFLDFAHWVAQGCYYAILDVPAFPKKPIHIGQIKHSGIRQSKAMRGRKTINL